MINKKKIKKWIIILGIGLILWPIMFCSFWWTLAWLSLGSPDWLVKIENNYRKLPSKVLIRKFKNSYDNPYHPGFFAPHSSIALDVLVERREKEAVSTILKFLHSWSEVRRQTAIRSLATINDARAIEPLMNILKKGEKHPDYDVALSALADMKYEGAFPYVIEIANKDYPDNCEAITLLEEYEKPESISLLLEIKSKIQDGTPNARFYKNVIDDAIKHIESLQEQKK